MTKTCMVTGLFIALGVMAHGQAPLSFQEALTKTLENNYDIRLSQIDEQIAENNTELGANGYLPTLISSGGYNWTFYQGTNKLRTAEQKYDAANSYNYNGGITLSYSIFDGFGRKALYQQAMGSKALSTLELRSIMENTVLQLGQTFHEVSRLQQQTASLDSTLAISIQRLRRVDYGHEFGQTTQLDILNAQVDMNTDSINLINSRQQLANTRRSLNLIMGEPVETIFEIKGSVQLQQNIDADRAVASALQNGSSAQIAQRIAMNADLGVSASKSVWYPNLGVSGSYQYRGSEDPNGAFLIGSNNYGPTAGINLSWTLFDGRNNTQVKNAKLQQESSILSLERTSEQVTTNALNAHGAYQNALYVLEASKVTVATAGNNYQRSEESYKLGQIGSVEFRQAQLNLLTAELQLSRSLYDAKNAELQLLALMGVLIE